MKAMTLDELLRRVTDIHEEATKQDVDPSKIRVVAGLGMSRSIVSEVRMSLGPGRGEHELHMKTGRSFR